MRLETIAVAVRPRAGFEALDLGFRMVASWWRPVFATWCAVVLPVALVLHGIFWTSPIVASVLLWWLKPAFDRFVLHVLSRCVFGTPPRLSDTLRDWRRILSPGLFAALTWRRLDPARSFTLPVVQLEGQIGRAAAARRKLLGQRLRGIAVWLTVACANFVGIFQLAFGFTITQLLPVGDPPENATAAASASAGFLPSPDWWQLGDGIVYLLSETLMEPFFVAGGFALYLSRRVMLEGWDVELALRRMAARLAARAATRRGPAAAKAGIAALLALGLCVLAMPARAECPPTAPAAQAPAAKPDASQAKDDESDDDEDEDEDAAPPASATPDCAPDAKPLLKLKPPEDTAAHRAIVDVMQDKLFGHYEDVDHWKYRFDQDPKRPDASKEPSWLRKLGRLLGQGAQALSWVLIGAIVLALIVITARRFGEQRALASALEAPPTELFGLKIAPDSLPDDIAAAALALVEAGQLRAALSLIYRGALSHLVHDLGLRVLAGDTEGDVLSSAQALLPPAGQDYFARVVAQWIAVAYALRAPEPEAVRALCAEFDRHLRAAPAPPAGVAAQGAPA